VCVCVCASLRQLLYTKCLSRRHKPLVRISPDL